MNVSSVIFSTSLEEARAQYPLPDYLTHVVYYFEKTHIIYRNVKFALIVKGSPQKTERGNPLVYGTALGAAASLTEMTNYSLQICLITKCVSVIITQYGKVHQAFYDLEDVLYNRYPIYTPIPTVIPQLATRRIFSPIFEKAIKHDLPLFLTKIVRILKYTRQLFSEIFQLSMYLQDTRLLAQGDTAQLHYACTDLVVELQDYEKHLKDPLILKQEMVVNSLVADIVLRKFQSNHTITTLSSRIQAGFNIIRNNQVVIEIGETIQETMEELLGNGTSDLVFTFNTKNKLNKEFASERYPPWSGQPDEIKSSQTSASQVKAVQESSSPITPARLMSSLAYSPVKLFKNIFGL